MLAKFGSLAGWHFHNLCFDVSRSLLSSEGHVLVGEYCSFFIATEIALLSELFAGFVPLKFKLVQVFLLNVANNYSLDFS